jgi:hypothetical protein
MNRILSKTLLCILFLAGCGRAFGQPSTVPLSSFGAGYGSLSGTVHDVQGLVGQTIAGRSSGSGNVVHSGFLPATLVSLRTLDVPGTDSGLPKEFALTQNFPNPFNPTTRIIYQLAATSEVRLILYDLLGRHVAVLANEKKDAGRYEVELNASRLASGVYLYRMSAGSFVQTRKMIVLK